MPTVDWVVFCGGSRLGVIKNESGNVGDLQFYPAGRYGEKFAALKGRQFPFVEYAWNAIRGIVAESLHSQLSYHRRECHKFTDAEMNEKYPNG